MFYKRWRDFVGLVLLILVGGLWVVLNHSNFFFLSTLQLTFTHKTGWPLASFHSRRIKTEEKSKVVAAVYSIPCCASRFAQDDFEE